MQKYNTPFGNKISPFSRFSSTITYKIARKLFGKNNPPLDLVAIPKGQVYKDFNVWTLIERSDVENHINPKTDKPYQFEEINPKKSLIIGTIRMGFGHWRIAIALASAAHSLGVKSYLLDLMSFQNTNIGQSINFLENFYNRFSRLSQKSKWFNDHIWEKLTSNGNLKLNSSVTQRNISNLFTPAFENLPKDIPLVAAHPWVGHGAVLAGCKNVISMIPDNLPLAFWLVEGTTHTVQSPSGYMGYRTLMHMNKGAPIKNVMPQDKIKLTGHYVDYEIEIKIKEDCKRRLNRIKEKEPRRFLLTMGGAGAQALKFADICHYCKDYVSENKAALFINMGDHKGRWEILKNQLDKYKIPYFMHDQWNTTQEFIQKMENSVISGIHIFLHDDFYAAVYSTNLLLRQCDVMITKPSELSFYPIPKLFIQRVGRHEAWGAIRSSEIGDGTKEITEPEILHNVLRTMIEEDDLLEMNINYILENDRTKIYDGAYNVVKLAVSSSV